MGTTAKQGEPWHVSELARVATEGPAMVEYMARSRLRVGVLQAGAGPLRVVRPDAAMPEAVDGAQLVSLWPAAVQKQLDFAALVGTRNLAQKKEAWLALHRQALSLLEPSDAAAPSLLAAAGEEEATLPALLFCKDAHPLLNRRMRDYWAERQPAFHPHRLPVAAVDSSLLAQWLFSKAPESLDPAMHYAAFLCLSSPAALAYLRRNDKGPGFQLRRDEDICSSQIDTDAAEIKALLSIDLKQSATSFNPNPNPNNNSNPNQSELIDPFTLSDLALRRLAMAELWLSFVAPRESPLSIGPYRALDSQCRRLSKALGCTTAPQLEETLLQLGWWASRRDLSPAPALIEADRLATAFVVGLGAMRRDLLQINRRLSEDVLADPLLERRVDLRRKVVPVAIDPVGTRMYDDAFSAPPTPQGLSAAHGVIQMDMHIADLARWVPEGSVLDRLARARQVSSRGAVAVDILPERLRHIASLSHSRSSVALTVRLSCGPDAKATQVEVLPTIIPQVRRIRTSKDDPLLTPFRPPAGPLTHPEADLAFQLRVLCQRISHSHAPGRPSFNNVDSVLSYFRRALYDHLAERLPLPPTLTRTSDLPFTRPLRNYKDLCSQRLVHDLLLARPSQPAQDAGVPEDPTFEFDEFVRLVADQQQQQLGYFKLERDLRRSQSGLPVRTKVIAVGHSSIHVQLPAEYSLITAVLKGRYAAVGDVTLGSFVDCTVKRVNPQKCHLELRI